VLARVLKLSARMRYVLAIAFAACSRAAMHRTFEDDVDAPACDIGELQIAAPVEREHYDASLDVLVDDMDLWTQLTVTISDDFGDALIQMVDFFTSP
jgi:hypothetical protein